MAGGKYFLFFKKIGRDVSLCRLRERGLDKSHYERRRNISAKPPNPSSAIAVGSGTTVADIEA